jgi:hypothetical protein
MKPMRYLLAAVIVAWCSSAAQAQWLERRDVARASQALTERAVYFQRVVQVRTGFSFLADEALLFAASAQQLHRNVLRGGDYEQALSDYAVMEANYRALRRSFRQAQQVARDLYMLQEWNLLAATMDRVAAAMDVPADLGDGD